MRLAAEQPRTQRLHGHLTLLQGVQTGQLWQVALQQYQLAFVVEVLLQQGQCLRFGGGGQLIADMGLQALDALRQAFLTDGAEEVIEDLHDVAGNPQIALLIDLEYAIHLGAAERGGQLFGAAW